MNQNQKGFSALAGIIIGLVILAAGVNFAFADAALFKTEPNPDYGGCAVKAYYPCGGQTGVSCSPYLNNPSYKYIGAHENTAMYCPTVSYQNAQCPANEELVECKVDESSCSEGSCARYICSNGQSAKEVSSKGRLLISELPYGAPGGSRYPSEKYCLSLGLLQYNLKNQLFSFEEFGIKFDVRPEWGDLVYNKNAATARGSKFFYPDPSAPAKQLIWDTVGFSKGGSSSITRFTVDPADPTIASFVYEDVASVESIKPLIEALNKLKPGEFYQKSNPNNFPWPAEIILTRNNLKMARSSYGVPGYAVLQAEYVSGNYYYRFLYGFPTYNIDRSFWPKSKFSNIAEIKEWAVNYPEIRKVYDDWDNLVQSASGISKPAVGIGSFTKKQFAIGGGIIGALIVLGIWLLIRSRKGV